MKQRIEPLDVKVGDRLYRVVYDPDDVWSIQERLIKKVTSTQFTLNQPFSFHIAFYGWIPKTYIGKEYHRTAADALEDFGHRQWEAIESARRKIKEATRALEWVATLHPRIRA